MASATSPVVKHCLMYVSSSRRAASSGLSGDSASRRFVSAWATGAPCAIVVAYARTESPKVSSGHAVKIAQDATGTAVAAFAGNGNIGEQDAADYFSRDS